MIEARGRPGAVTLIGCVWLGVGAVMAVFGVRNLVLYLMLYRFVPHPGPGGAAAVPDPVSAVVGYVLVHHFGTLAVVQVALAGFVLVSAVMFLRLRPWARLSLELMTWLVLVFAVGLAADSLLMRERAARWLSETGVQMPIDLFLEGRPLPASPAMLVAWLPPIVLLRYLRGTMVRLAFVGLDATGSRRRVPVEEPDGRGR